MSGSSWTSETWDKSYDQSGHSDAREDRTFGAEWDNHADVCTVCRQKSKFESECINKKRYTAPNSYQGICFKDGCKFCKAVPSFHHGGCCPWKPSNKWKYTDDTGKVNWPRDSWDEETKRKAEYKAISWRHKTTDLSYHCTECGSRRTGEQYPVRVKWCNACGKKAQHHDDCCPNKHRSKSQQKWQEEDNTRCPGQLVRGTSPNK